VRSSPRAPVASIGYDAPSKTLEVEFTSGEVYRYLDVPASTWRAFRSAESKGTFFKDQIRGAFLFSHLPSKARRI
jgi:KTSC domain-containing protein